MLYVSGISISLFISALLANKRGKSKADVVLMVWMLAMAVHLILYYLNFGVDLFVVPRLLVLEIPYPLIHGPLLYLYVASMTGQLPSQKWLPFLHFIPLLLGYFYLIPILFSSPLEKMAFYKSGFLGHEGFMTFGLLLIALSGVLYILWSILLLIRHKKNIRNEFSDLENVNLSWLQFLIYGFSFVWSIVIFTNKDEYIFVGVTVFVILIGYLGLQQPTIFQSQALTVKPGPKSQGDLTTKKKKYEKSGLDEQQSKEFHKRLIHLFENEDYYKKNEFSIQQLASELGILPNYLSQIINEKEGKSFYDFVNSYRLNAFKQMIKDHKHENFTLLALAYECGFNSKSSFNRYFKKQTGVTPSEYVKNLTE
jgi:AraC-like DNA-binding protein